MKRLQNLFLICLVLGAAIEVITTPELVDMGSRLNWLKILMAPYGLVLIWVGMIGFILAFLSKGNRQSSEQTYTVTPKEKILEGTKRTTGRLIAGWSLIIVSMIAIIELSGNETLAYAALPFIMLGMLLPLLAILYLIISAIKRKIFKR